MNDREIVLANLPDQITVVVVDNGEAGDARPLYEVREHGQSIGEAGSLREVAQILAALR